MDRRMEEKCAVLRETTDRLSRAFHSLSDSMKQIHEFNQSLVSFHSFFGRLVGVVGSIARCWDPSLPKEETSPSTSISSSETPARRTPARLAASLRKRRNPQSRTPSGDPGDLDSRLQSTPRILPIAASESPPRPKLSWKRIANALPEKYRRGNHRETIQVILKYLRDHSNGCFVSDISKDIQRTRLQCNEALTALSKVGIVLRERLAAKGVLYSLNWSNFLAE